MPDFSSPQTCIKPYENRHGSLSKGPFSPTLKPEEPVNFNGVQYVGINNLELVGSFSWQVNSGAVVELQVEEERLIAPDGSIISNNRTIWVTGARLTAGTASTLYRTMDPLA